VRVPSGLFDEAHQPLVRSFELTRRDIVPDDGGCAWLGGADGVCHGVNLSVGRLRAERNGDPGLCPGSPQSCCLFGALPHSDGARLPHQEASKPVSIVASCTMAESSLPQITSASMSHVLSLCADSSSLNELSAV
jgi:hypothetical protein